MPKVVREDIDNLNATLTVTIDKSDYESKFNAELSKYQREAHMKGFRKGKVPTSVLRKMYGKPILGDIVGEMLQKEVNDYLDSEAAKLVISQPLPSASQEYISFDANDLREYTFKFDLGLAQDFDLKGLSPDTVIEHFKLDVTEEMVDEVLARALKEFRTMVSVEGHIEDGDRMTLQVRELENGGPKEGGLENEFVLLYDSLGSEQLKETFRAHKKGDTLIVNPFELEANLDEPSVRKYLLGLEDDDIREVGTEFEATIVDVQRMTPGEMGPEFYRSLLGENAPSTEEEARGAIKISIQQDYENKTRPLLYKDLKDRLMELNPIELPVDFFRRTLKAQNEGMTDEDIELELPEALESLRWSLISRKLADHFSIEVQERELLDRIIGSMIANIGSLPPGLESVLEQSAARILYENEDKYRSLYASVLSDKIFEAIARSITLEPVLQSPEGLRETMVSKGLIAHADEEEE
jgi:trigger factor